MTRKRSAKSRLILHGTSSDFSSLLTDSGHYLLPAEDVRPVKRTRCSSLGAPKSQVVGQTCDTVFYSDLGRPLTGNMSGTTSTTKKNKRKRRQRQAQVHRPSLPPRHYIKKKRRRRQDQVPRPSLPLRHRTNAKTPTNVITTTVQRPQRPAGEKDFLHLRHPPLRPQL